MSESKDDETVELVDFHTARSTWGARIIVAIMADAGIPAFVAGGMLTDEFSLSQQLSNLDGVCVRVPGNRLADAQAAHAAARKAGEMLTEDSDTGESDTGEIDSEEWKV